MRSDLPRFQRPRPPKIDSFIDGLELELREEIKRNPPRRHRATRLFDRLGRTILRPVFPGVTVAVLLTVTFLTAQSEQAIVMNDLSARSSSIERVTSWVEVVDVPDPSPTFVPFVRDAPRFVAFAMPEPDPTPAVRLVPF